ncbi:MAG: alpha/beta hydrolase [Bacteroidetes bacterium]|nr:MAG: alpha/beta hydrolase [Bacteroidota bacterium]
MISTCLMEVSFGIFLLVYRLRKFLRRYRQHIGLPVLEARSFEHFIYHCLMRKTLKVGDVTWRYLDHGVGDEVWLAFHGYGQEADVMLHFMQHLRPNARILSFDLPLHGETTVKKNRPLSIGDAGELLGTALREVGASKCSVAGFSLGGKMVLKMVEMTPAKIDRILLIAPDGLKVNPLYWIVTNTWLGKMLFQLVIVFPGPVLGFSKLLAVIGLMDKRIDQFVRAQLGTREKRQKVLDTWIAFRHIRPILDQVRKRIWRYQIKPVLVFGKRDRVIHPKLAKKLSGENCKTAELILLDAGHNLTTKEVALTLKAYFERTETQTNGQ